MKKNKYNYYLVIQQSGEGWGWEDVSQYETDSTFHPDKETRKLYRHDLTEYIMSNTGNVRTIRRRELKPVEIKTKHNPHNKGCYGTAFSLITVEEGVQCSNCLALVIDNRQKES